MKVIQLGTGPSEKQQDWYHVTIRRDSNGQPLDDGWTAERKPEEGEDLTLRITLHSSEILYQGDRHYQAPPQMETMLCKVVKFGGIGPIKDRFDLRVTITPLKGTEKTPGRIVRKSAK